MYCNDSANEGGSSPETVIARSSSEDDPRRIVASNQESSSSLDAPAVLASGQVPGQKKRKKSRFGSLKSSFRKEGGGLFKLKKKTKNVDIETAVEAEPEEEKGDDCWEINSRLLFEYIRKLTIQKVKY